MQTGSLPPATVYGTWVENMEVWDVLTDLPMNWDSVKEAILFLRWPGSGPASLGYSEMTLTKTGGGIIFPSDGIIQWRAEVGAMGTIKPGLYEVVLLLKDDTDTVPMILGTISIVGW